MSKAEQILREHNLSVTDARKSVLEVFLKTKKPLTVKDFRKKKKFEAINESSIYRNLSKLEDAGIIQPVPGAGEFQSYELVPNGHHHHHHISCVKCKTVQCLDMCGLEKRMQTMADSVGFLLTGHSLQLMGVCSNCN